MTHVCIKAAAIALALAVAHAAAAQSLGDVARKEEARRKVTAGNGKVYTNDNLRGRESTPPPPVAAPPAQAPPSPSGEQGKNGEKPAEADDPKKDEAYWRGRMTEARTALQRATAFQEALQSQINGLANEFAAKDDPAQRNLVATKRQSALSELDRVKKEITDLQQQLRDIEEEARKAGVPPGWLR